MSTTSELSDYEFVPTGPKKSTFIKISVNGHTSGLVDATYRVKSTAKLGKLMADYAKRAHVNPDDIKFIYENHRARNYHTPEFLQMQDGALLDIAKDCYAGFR